MTARYQRPRVALVAVGDELLAGTQLNGNATVLGQRLESNGLRVALHVVVGDDEEQIAVAVRTAAAGNAAVVVSGGLGPTQDDLTREGLARAAGVALVRDVAAEASLRARMEAFAGPGSVPPAANWRQADVPVGARSLPNAVGSAPGLALDVDGTPVYALPGVPSEFTAMLDAAVLPDLVNRWPQRPAIAQATVRTVGVWESAVAEAMAPEIERSRGRSTIGFLATLGETRVVITAEGNDEFEAQERLAPSVDFARQALGDAVYEAASLEAEIVALLGRAGATVACAESLTAGLVTARIANVPGASAVLRGGIVAYATDLKSSLLEIPRLNLSTWQAVSEETAGAMATGVTRVCGSTYGLGLTGVAGPADQDGSPPGTVFVAVAGPAGVDAHRFALPGGRDQVRALAVTSALALLRTAIRQDLTAGAERDGAGP